MMVRISWRRDLELMGSQLGMLQKNMKISF